MVTVRAMTGADIEAVSAIRVTGWRTAYAGVVPRTWLERMTVEEDARERRRRFASAPAGVYDLVAVDAGGAVVGWACLGSGPDEGAGGTGTRTGELYALYVLPALVGSGVGRALIEAVHARARELGLGRLLLWVLDDNARARRFYERAGYAADGAVQADEYDGVSLPEVRYGLAL
ncbi:GNAT family N-acetyltransferase [Streptomyces sp. NPDC093224]|uniref:GNAT family N-acetyltransferase n=1 Tax=Streptomyces sp. NPDC093224 TaxID=3155198 RepID=UPI003447E4D5